MGKDWSKTHKIVLGSIHRILLLRKKNSCEGLTHLQVQPGNTAHGVAWQMLRIIHMYIPIVTAYSGHQFPLPKTTIVELLPFGNTYIRTLSSTLASAFLKYNHFVLSLYLRCGILRRTSLSHTHHIHLSAYNVVSSTYSYLLGAIRHMHEILCRSARQPLTHHMTEQRTKKYSRRYNQTRIHLSYPSYFIITASASL